MSRGSEDTIFISAANKTNIDKLNQAIFNKVADKYFTIYPNYTRSDYLSAYGS